MNDITFQLLFLVSLRITTHGFLFPHIVPTKGFSQRRHGQSSVPRHAAPNRLPDNADGTLYVNDHCIDCATCSHFAPNVFSRTNKGHHIVYAQPATEDDIDNARAAMAACPVAAIRTETLAHRNHRSDKVPTSPADIELARNMALSPKLNGRPLPFPRKLTDHVWYVGYHNENSFGATPYLACIEETECQSKCWIMIDTPRYCQLAVDAVLSLTGPSGPDYLLLTHVDDTADHDRWKLRFPNLKRIFHANELGRNNWVHDLNLENVEILVYARHGQDSQADSIGNLQAYDVLGQNLFEKQVSEGDNPVIIYHTPGHSPGSLSMLLRSDKILFTGDTLAYTERTKSLTGFPRYGRDLKIQKGTLERIMAIDWDIVAPGHGHVKDYTGSRDLRNQQLLDAMNELDNLHSRRASG